MKCQQEEAVSLALPTKNVIKVVKVHGEVYEVYLKANKAPVKLKIRLPLVGVGNPCV